MFVRKKNCEGNGKGEYLMGLVRWLDALARGLEGVLGGCLPMTVRGVLGGMFSLDSAAI